MIKKFVGLPNQRLKNNAWNEVTSLFSWKEDSYMYMRQIWRVWGRGVGDADFVLRKPFDTIHLLSEHTGQILNVCRLGAQKCEANLKSKLG